MCARSGPTLAVGQITETALRFLLENIFRNIRVLARHASQVLNKILNVLDNLHLKALITDSLCCSEAFFLARLLLNTSTLSLWKTPFRLQFIYKSMSFCVYFVCMHGSDHAD